MKKTKYKQFLRAVNNYLVFFLLVAFMVSCCTMLFVSVMRDSMGLVLTKDNVAAAAKLTSSRERMTTLISFRIFLASSG